MNDLLNWLLLDSLYLYNDFFPYLLNDRLLHKFDNLYYLFCRDLNLNSHLFDLNDFHWLLYNPFNIDNLLLDALNLDL
jgi:hypothetical protein